MQELDDIALLRQFAAAHSEAAFEQLVARHAGFVHSAALRQVRDPQWAAEITQAVFLILARKAARISDKTILTGWLFKTTRFVALAQVRAEAKRRKHEQETQMQTRLQTEPSSDAGDQAWAELAPLLDQALAQLNETDRQAVLLRYFESKSLAEVGNKLGAGEDTAHKRVSRALEKLRKFFAKHRVFYSTAIIAGAISANAVQAAPPGLVAAIPAMALKGSAISVSILALVKEAIHLMTIAKLQTAALVAAAAVLATGGSVVVSRLVAQENQMPRPQTAQGAPLPPVSQAAARPAVAPAIPVSGPIIQFDNTTFDFNIAEVGEKVRHTYIVTNPGNETLLISNVVPGCHCTTVGDWTHSIEPGKTGGITMQFDTSGLTGTVSRTIDVFSNAKNQPIGKTILLLKGTVWQSIKVTPATAFVAISPDETNELTTTNKIVNTTDNPITFSNPISDKPLFTAVLKEIKPGKEYDLVVTSHPPYKQGMSQGAITVNTSLASTPTISVPAMANVVQAVQVYPPQITFNTAPDRWQTNRITIHANTAKLLTLTNPKASDSRILVEVQPPVAKGIFNLLVAIPPGFALEPGQHAEVTIETSHPSYPLVRVPIMANARPRTVPTSTPQVIPSPVAASTVTNTVDTK